MNSVAGSTSISSTRLSQALVFVLVAIAVIGIELVVADPGAAPARALIKGVALTSMAALLAFLLRRREGGEQLPRMTFIALAIATVSPPLVQGYLSGAAVRDQPMEVVQLCICRNLILGLAALSGRQVCQRLAALLGSFLVLLAAAKTEHLTGLVLVAAYAGPGCLWLMQIHWSHSRAQGAFPVLPGFVFILVTCGSIAIDASTRHRIASALDGFFPSSGGIRWSRETARSGIGDGTDEVSGSKRPKTVGYDDSNIFVESKPTGLYDAFVETYGEIIKPTELKKMMMLRQKDIELGFGAMTADLRSGKSFSIQREPPAQDGDRQPRAANALLFVSGETPVRLRMVAYGDFDGIAWHVRPESHVGVPLQNEPEGSWIKVVTASTPAFFSGVRSWQLKIGTLDTDLIPTPAYLRRFMMGRVTKLGFFSWAQSGILKMTGRTVPTGTVVKADCYGLDETRLAGESFARHSSDRGGTGTCSEAVADVARRWAAEAPRGWGQIDALIRHLHRQCQLDPSARSHPENGDVVEDFVLKTRRGPDYLFASAAVLMLREAGYTARLASGFYVSPERFDPATDQTPVTAKDAHFWAEVLLVDGTWAEVEATPGYRTLGSVDPWCLRATVAGRIWFKKHMAGALIATAAAVALIRFRLAVFDLVLTLSWWATWRQNRRTAAIGTLRLLERRLRLNGRRRPPAFTRARWFRAVQNEVPGPFRPDVIRLVNFADFAAYAPDHLTPPASWDEAFDQLCRRIGWRLTVGRLRTSQRIHSENLAI
jgi:hypothetical protein